MEKSKQFARAKFSAEVLTEAIELFWARSKSTGKITDITIEHAGELWTHDDLMEFFADYRKSDKDDFRVDIIATNYRLIISSLSGGTRVVVRAPARNVVEEIFSTFERNYESSVIPPPPAPPPVTPTIFIGHGGSQQWRDLKDHLHEKHGFEVVAYETGARAGHTIRDILDQMASNSSMAFLVFTAEDEQKDGTFRARQNVVHETGLFQGRLGFTRAIALIENGVEIFSNLQGIDQIRFSKIRETFGEVLATIKREFEKD